MPALVDCPGLVPCVASVAPAGRESFFAEMLAVRRNTYADRPFQLQFSINTTDGRLRRQLMPISGKYPLKQLMKALRDYPLPKRQRITIEYIMFDGINDSLEDGKKLAAL